MKILVTSDGPDTIERAVDYTLLFAGDAAITLLHAHREGQNHQQHAELLDRLAERIQLETNGPVTVRRLPGPPENAVLEEVKSHKYDLVVLGVHLRPRWHNLRPKHEARDIAKRLSVPLLVVFPQWEKLERILVWTEGKQPDRLALALTGQLAAEVGAACSVLHVMSQVPLRADADTEDLERDAKSLIEHESKEGGYLEDALSILGDAGVPSYLCNVNVRHGMTVDEIIKESNEGDFDLIVIGGLEVPGDQPWQELRELVQEDIADRVLTEAQRPVLITRKPDADLDWDDM